MSLPAEFANWQHWNQQPAIPPVAPPPEPLAADKRERLIDTSVMYLREGKTLAEIRDMMLDGIKTLAPSQADDVLAEAERRFAAETAAPSAPVTLPAENGVVSRKTFKQLAENSVARGERRVLPIAVGGKNPTIRWKGTPFDLLPESEWQAVVPNWINEQAAAFPDCNCAVIAKPNERLFIDEDDSEAFRRGYEQWAGEPFPLTYTTSARANRCQSHWLQTDATRKMGNVGQQATFSVRQHNLYVLAEGSQHKNGVDTYRRVVDAPVIAMPDKLVEYILFLRKRDKAPSAVAMDAVVLTGTDEQKLQQLLAAIPNESIPHGTHDATLISIAGKFRQTFKMSAEQMYPHLVAICERCCAGYGSDYEDMCWKKAQSAARYEIKPQGHEVTLSSVQPQPQPNQNQQGTGVVPMEPTEPQPQYAMTPEEVEAEFEKDYPCLLLPEQPGPSWDDSIMYGIAGDIVREASKYCESHPAGMYVDLLVSLGNIIGRGPYFNINKTRHYTNEFMVRVGDSSLSRKGTGRDMIDDLIAQVDPIWKKNRVMKGFGSGEAIVNEIRDPRTQQIMSKGIFKTIVAPGVDDKRLCVRVGEISSVFLMASKPGSLASGIFRDGWDGQPLGNIVKGKSTQGISNSNTCAEPMISISGDSTIEELVNNLPPGSVTNGFGNRFLFVYVYRVKETPNGGPDVDWTPFLDRLRASVQDARQEGYVPLSKAGNKLWGRFYGHLDTKANRPPGIAGKLTDRAPAHVRRIALILALMDDSAEFYEVDAKHIHAARAIWDYCQESAAYIFNGRTAEQQRIVNFIVQNSPKEYSPTGGVTLSDIREKLFARNRRVDWIRSQLTEIMRRDANVCTSSGRYFWMEKTARV